jgi:acetate kinase
MKVLVTNVGSTSLKYRLYEFPQETLLAVGRVERIGTKKGTASWMHGDFTGEQEQSFSTHREAIEFILDRLREYPLHDVAELDCVAFKTVIAKKYVGCEILNDDVLQAMEDFVFLAPAHNPPYINAIRLFRQLLPPTPLIGLFEPAFHLTMPDYAQVYPLPKEWRENYAIRRYGFHGASHRYVSERIPQLMGREKNELRVISCHLGGSSSLCAIQGGKSIDTSMGFTPQTGVFHATRVGELDPYVALFMMQEKGLSIDQVNTILTKESGFLGLSGVSEDLRDIEAAIDDGNDQARLAFQSFCYGVKKYIGSYFAILGGLDAVAFAGGIGEKGVRVRAEICRGLEHLGIHMDGGKNNRCKGEETEISPNDSPAAVWVVPTNEELIVARAAFEKLSKS